MEIGQYYFKGLTDEEVSQRIEDGKVNGDQNVKTKSVGEIIRTHVFTFFNLLFLIFAAIILIFDLGFTQLGFMGVVFSNALIGIIQELTAKKTIDKLSLLSAPKVTVIRNEIEKEIELKDIVMDDIIKLETGDQVCSDAVLKYGYLEVNESLITGESDTVAKRPGDQVYSGSYIVSGKAVTQVIRVGKDNYATRISIGAKYLKPNNSVIMKDIIRFIKLMTFVLVPVGIILFCVKLLGQDIGYKTALRDSVTMMVGMIPSGLVALTSAVFCVGVIKMARHKALAQDLFATEALARVDILCIDKTGTITEGTMEVAEIIPFGYSVTEIEQILKDVVTGIGDNNTTANAIKEYTELRYKSRDPFSIVSFSSARKWSAANFEDGGYIIGAPEFVLKNMSETDRDLISKQALKGYRVLVLARTANPLIDDDNIENPQILAYVLITDKIRQEAPETLAYFAKQGVKIKVLSGDNPITVRSVAERAGLEDCNHYVDASTLSDEDIPSAIEYYSIFGRVSPDQKLKFVKALKAQGHTVGMTGDGVNDVLALKESDCSIAMAAGSDAAKNVAQIVLLDSNFASMPKIVGEGRKSINNLVRSSSLYLVKTFFSLFNAIVFLLIATPLPYLLSHQTLLGGITTGVPSFLLALEKNEERIHGQFIDNVIEKSLPGSFSLFLAVMAMTLVGIFATSTRAMFTDIQFQSTTLIIMAFISFMYLFQVCIPINKKRIGMIFLLAIAFIVSFILPITQQTIIITNDLPLESIYLILPIALVSIPLFILFNFLFIGFGRKRLASNLIDSFMSHMVEIKDFYSEKHKAQINKFKEKRIARKKLKK